MFLSFCILDDFFRFSRKIGFWGILGPPGNHASWWIRDLWSKGVSLILAYFLWVFAFWMIFFRFSKNFGFWVFLVHPTVVSVLLSASVERCFVFRMLDFLVEVVVVVVLDWSGSGSGLIRLGRGAWFAWAGLIRLRRVPDLHEQVFWSCSKNLVIRQTTYFFWKS